MYTHLCAFSACIGTWWPTINQPQQTCIHVPGTLPHLSPMGLQNSDAVTATLYRSQCWCCTSFWKQGPWLCAGPGSQDPTDGLPSLGSPNGECGPWQKKWPEFIPSNVIIELRRPSSARAASEPWGRPSFEVPIPSHWEEGALPHTHAAISPTHDRCCPSLTRAKPRTFRVFAGG